jgi:hypothetical protein
VLGVDGAALVGDARDITEAAPRREHRLVGRQPGRTQAFFFHRQVERDLVVDLARDSRLALR